MFRNLTIFTINKDVPINSEGMEIGRFTPCGPSAMSSRGWRPVRDDALHLTVNGQTLVSLMTETRLLPASVVNREVKRRMDEYKAQHDGEQMPREEVIELKALVWAELTPKAFTTISSVDAWIDPVNGYLCVNTTSQHKADDIAYFLRASHPALEPKKLKTVKMAENSMWAWLVSGEEPDNFTVDMDLDLKGEHHARVRYENENLHRDDVRSHLVNGKRPVKLAMTHDGNTSFVLNANNTITKVKLIDIIKAKPEGPVTREEQFDADFTIMTGAYGRLINAVVELLGGIPPQEKEENGIAQ